MTQSSLMIRWDGSPASGIIRTSKGEAVPSFAIFRAGTPRKEPFREEFVRGMRDLGYVEGRNIAYQFRLRRDEQIAGVQKVLGAAAWTYVAAAVCAIGSWLFYVFVLLSQRSVADRR
jgi:Putative neutral zinc metallopeptidase